MSEPEKSNTGEPRRIDENEIVAARSDLGVTSTSSGTATKDDQKPPVARESGSETRSDIGVAGHSNRSGKETIASSVAQLVRGWEDFMSDDQSDSFPSLQMLQNLELCGRNEAGVARLTAGPAPAGKPPAHSAAPFPQGHPLAPPAFRHTHSSPLQSRSSMFDHHGDTDDDDDEDGAMPPPVPLDPFQRSSSTPSAFRSHSVYSAFDTASPSAFTSMSDPGIRRQSAFDPVKYYARALEDMERTSIEVMDMSPADQEEPAVEQKRGKRGAASRAARFLSDVRVLRRRRRIRGGRENPAQPPSVSSGSKGTDPNVCEDATRLDTSVTIVTESEMNANENNTSALSQSSELSAILKGAAVEDAVDDVYSPPVHESDQEDGKEEEEPAARQYQQLDSDVDEEEQHYQRIEAQLQTESPGTVPSPSYQQFVDDRLAASPTRYSMNESSRSRIRVQISNTVKSVDRIEPGSVASPSPTQMERGEGSSLTPGSNDDSMTTSPGTPRSSVTGSSSGHTTQATSTSSGQQSALSTISETDREVMEANKEGKRRRSLQSLPAMHKSEGDGTSINSGSTNSTNPSGYLALPASPVLLREGASHVPAESYTASSPQANAPSIQAGMYSRSQTTSSSSRRSGRTNSSGMESESGTNTSSSGSSREEPPTFVSYLDREASSDLTSLREATETSSQRAAGNDGEAREASPSELVSYPKVLFEEAEATSSSSQQTELFVPAQQQRGRQDRFRSRPPRSPVKGSRPVTTPPPRGSVSPMYHHQLSPPPNIVDHPDSNISRPYVMRTMPEKQDLVLGKSRATNPVVLSSPVVGNVTRIPGDGADLGAQEVEEGSIEILKTDSKDEMSSSKLVTPEKDAGN